jgi:hypothetical protein
MRYLQDLVIGGVDGTLSSFSFLAMLKSAAFPRQYILIILILKLLSDGVSLSLSNYSGRKSDIEIRETLQVQSDPLSPNPYTAGLSTLIGFLVFGSIPVLIYHYVLHDIANIWKSAVLILGVLFVMGVLKTLVIQKDLVQGFHGGAEFGLIGMIGVVASTSIGLIIKTIAGAKYHLA